MTTTLTRLATEDVAAIRHVCDNAWTLIMLNANWDGMIALLTDDVVFQPPEQPIVEGKKAVRSWMDSFPPVRAFRCKVEHIEGLCDFAAARGTFEWTVEPTPGTRVSAKGKWISTFRKQSDGRWLVARYPNFMAGGSTKYEFRSDGSTLSLTTKSTDETSRVGERLVHPSEPPSETRMKLSRLE